MPRFCQEHELKIINGSFKKRWGKKWSWLTPNHEYKTLIDYFITTKNNNSIVNCNIDRNFNFNSDHCLLTIKLEIKIHKNKHNFSKNKTRKTLNPGLYLTEINEHLDKTIAHQTKENSVQLLYKQITGVVKKVVENSPETTRQENDPNNKITELKEEIKILQGKRSSFLRVKDKTINGKIELNLASKLIRNKLRQKNSLKREEIINNTLKGDRNITTQEHNGPLTF